MNFYWRILHIYSKVIMLCKIENDKYDKNLMMQETSQKAQKYISQIVKNI